MEKFVTIELRQTEKYRNNIAALQWAIDHAPAAHVPCLIDTKFIILKLCGAAEKCGAPAVQTGNSQSDAIAALVQAWDKHETHGFMLYCRDHMDELRQLAHV